MGSLETSFDLNPVPDDKGSSLNKLAYHIN